MTDVGGKTAFITGGANGIGLGIARAFAAAGAKLALIDLDGAALKQASTEPSKVTEVDTQVLDARGLKKFKSVSGIVESRLGPVSKCLSGQEQGKAHAQSDVMTDYLKKGTHPDRVGEMVLDAVRANRLYIHTDRVMCDRIEARAKALLDAMPPQ